MRFVAISGKRRSGKTTLAEKLFKSYGYIPLHLASPLKAMCKEQFGLSEAQVNGDHKESPTVYNRDGVFLTPRQIMIEMGRFYRSIDENFWVNKLILQAGSYPEGSVVVVPDVRFKNEIEALKKRGAYLVRLERDEALTGSYINDPSETELDNYKGWDLHVPADFNQDMLHLHQIATRVAAGLYAFTSRSY
jgi:hypothetical protein